MAASPCEDERRKGASPTDGGRVTLSTDANWNVPLQTRDKQLVMPMQSLEQRNIYAYKPRYNFSP